MVLGLSKLAGLRSSLLFRSHDPVRALAASVMAPPSMPSLSAAMHAKASAAPTPEEVMLSFISTLFLGFSEARSAIQVILIFELAFFAGLGGRWLCYEGCYFE